MNVPLILVRVILACVFAAAGAAKAIDLGRSRKAVAEFGVPPPLSDAVGVALPPVELAIAVLFLFPAFAAWAAIGSLVLLSVFTIAIAANLARGRRPECRRFGQIHPQPIGWSALVRNGLLALGAGVVLYAGPGTASWPGTASGYVALAGAGVAVFGGQTWLIFHLFKQHGRLLLRMDAIERNGGGQPPATLASLISIQSLPVGAPAPAFAAPSLSGAQVTLEMLQRRGKPILLVFSDPNCPACKGLWSTLREWQRDYRHAMTMAVVSQESSADELRRDEANHGLEILLQKADEVAKPYGATMTPSAVLVRSDGTIGSLVVISAGAIRELVSTEIQAVGQAPAASGNNAVVLESATAIS